MSCLCFLTATFHSFSTSFLCTFLFAIAENAPARSHGEHSVRRSFPIGEQWEGRRPSRMASSSHPVMVWPCYLPERAGDATSRSPPLCYFFAGWSFPNLVGCKATPVQVG
ncbi:hypothetical protein CONLIGDRAFT_396581 [Coniochaeta ligniaria NRRL 30616]|uniref:Secreted protein n=1 Tax=Coniochaeta ligniaria NRRL 30616 TaxID=1408157 RepID=A0A1J7J6H3_9PEZI|nr:hypothetical protein CONLIGDRAFT_396581 [Coniochaeta ligniaria NRRL 30616]